MLGAATNAKRSPETGDLSLQAVMVGHVTIVGDSDYIVAA